VGEVFARGLDEEREAFVGPPLGELDEERRAAAGGLDEVREAFARGLAELRQAEGFALEVEDVGRTAVATSLNEFTKSSEIQNGRRKWNALAAGLTYGRW
jgi:hypothetical protein